MTICVCVCLCVSVGYSFIHSSLRHSIKLLTGTFWIVVQWSWEGRYLPPKHIGVKSVESVSRSKIAITCGGFTHRFWGNIHVVYHYGNPNSCLHSHSIQYSQTFFFLHVAVLGDVKCHPILKTVYVSQMICHAEHIPVG